MKARIYNELERLRQEAGGRLDPAQIVAAARPKRSVLHSSFEWDDQRASDEYRLWQARQLIRVSVILLPGGTDEKIRAYVSLRDDRKEGGYRAIVEVMSNIRLRNKLLAEAKADMLVFRRKYAVLEELAGVFAAMKNARKTKPKRRPGRRKVA